MCNNTKHCPSPFLFALEIAHSLEHKEMHPLYFDQRNAQCWQGLLREGRPIELPLLPIHLSSKNNMYLGDQGCDMVIASVLRLGGAFLMFLLSQTKPPKPGRIVWSSM